MSHFYAGIVGNRGEATRTGTKNSGIRGHIRGWNIGGKVQMWHDNEAGRDVVELQITGGSENPYGKTVAIFTLDDDLKIVQLKGGEDNA